MKVLAGLVTQGTGSIGGMTMSKNKQGYYMRARTVPSNPKTIRQTAVRNGLSALAAAWATLTGTQQLGWNLYAKNVAVVLDNGQTKILSGFNWFVGANQLRIVASEPVVLDPPDIFTLAGTPYGVFFSYVFPASAVIKFDLISPPLAPGSGDLILVQIGRPQTLGTAYFTGPWQYVDQIDSYDAGAPVILDLSTAPMYLATSNQLQWVRITRILPDGRYSTPVHYGPIVGGGASDPYAFTSNPWVQSMGGTATESDSATIGTPATASDLGSGYAGLSFVVSGGAVVAATSGAAPGVYETVLQIGGSLGTSYLPVQITVT